MSDITPYRDAVVEQRPPPPTEIAFELSDNERRTNAVVVLQGIGLIGAITFVVGALNPVAAVLTAIGLGSALTAYLRTMRKGSALVLSVRDGVLAVESDKKPLHLLRLSALRQVEMESREFSSVTLHQEVGAPMMSSQVSSPVDVSRIVLIGEDGARLRLTETYGSYSECTSAFAKTRVFLRKHGWLPPDERPAYVTADTER